VPDCGRASRLAGILRRFGRFLSAGNDVDLNCAYLVGSEKFFERRHAGRGKSAAKTNVLDAHEGRFWGIAKVRQWPCHGPRSVAKVLDEQQTFFKELHKQVETVW